MDANGTPRPEKLGAYRIESLLGRGGMGEVYLAWDERLRRHVAIKRLRRDGKLGARQLERFRREARSVARLSHPAIVQVHDILDDDDGSSIVMEYVKGHRLSDLVKSRDIALADAVRLGREIADGLAEAHAKGLVHRDLKAENVIVTSAGRPKILDFGLALPLFRDEGDVSLTASGALVGTVRAMSPEQAEGEEIDHRADLFSLGVLLYEMLAGVSPFRGKNAVDTLRRVMLEAPKKLSEIVPDIPPKLCELVTRLLDKKPEHRPQNAHRVAAQLEEIALDLARGSSSAPEEAASPDEDTIAVNRVSGTGAFAISAIADADDVTLEASGSLPVIRVLVLVDLVGSTQMVERLGDARAVEVSRRHDRLARDLLARYDGLEIDKTDGFLLLFERPSEAVAFAIDYQQGVMQLARELDVELAARTGIHLGEVFLHQNLPGDVARGAKPLEVEGLAKPIAARIMSLAGERQILLSGFAFDLARRGAVGGRLDDVHLDWLAHGPYLFKGVDEPIEIFEVGVRGFAPLKAPPGSEKARRAVLVSDEVTLGWRPAVKQTIPHRSHWRLEKRLGEGGFGEVWLASHEATGEKRVFKFCFEAERLRTLQREVTLFRLLKEVLGHRDDIARVLDWNFEVAPYFLESEYSEGGNLADWCEQQGGLEAVPLAVRLELIAQVAEALAAAHSVGVLHKDVKPQNVLIRTDSANRPRAKLTDFGIGRLTNSAVLAAKGITAFGMTETLSSAGEVSSGGTLRFMAPELLEGKPATVQADIYSLGVMLYQVVVGDFSRALASGWRRQVDDEILAEDIALLVDGSPNRRPASAAEVADRLRTLDERRQRLEAERRAAREAERERLANERARRRRRVVTTAAAVVVSVAALLAVQATLARSQADRLRGQAEDLVSFMLGDLRDKLRPVGRLDVLDSVGDKALEYFASLDPSDMTPSTRARYCDALRQIGEVRMIQANLEGADQIFRQALERSRSLAESDPENPEWQLGLGLSHFWIGNVRLFQGRPDEALAEVEAYLEITRRLVDRDPDNVRYLSEMADAYSAVGDVLTAVGDVDGALRHLERSVEIEQRLADAHPERIDRQAELGSGYLRLGRALRDRGDLEGALDKFKSNVAVMERLLEMEGGDSDWQRHLALGHSWVSSILMARGELAEARRHRRRYLELARALVDLDPTNARWQSDLSTANLAYGKALAALGDTRAARPHIEQAVRFHDDLVRRDPTDQVQRRLLANAHNELSQLLLTDGDKAAAVAQANKARDLLSSLAADNENDAVIHLYLSRNALLLGQALFAAGDTDAARSAWQEAADTIEPFARNSRDYRFLSLSAVANLSLGRVEEARPAAVTLFAMGYAERDFIEACHRHGLSFPR